PPDPLQAQDSSAPAEGDLNRDPIRKRGGDADTGFRSNLPGAPEVIGPDKAIPFPEPDSSPPAPVAPMPVRSPEPAAGTSAEKPKKSFLKSLTGGGGKSEDKTPPAQEPVAAPAPPPPPPPPPEPVDEGDALRERIAARGNDPGPSTKTVEKNRKKMLRKHNRKAHRRVAAEKRGNGAFTTGVLLVLIVAAVLAALYLLAPQIVAQVPGAEPALENYITKVDEVREGLGGLVQNVVDKVEPLFADEEGG
ncbi:MAG: hypothetical protein AAF501_12535, partial [Pseudomonadota bacterium]